ncbi:MAG: Na/Pi cotransporter family protein [Clostridia bacterium]|nr:Na/Pi cotransporter family protein [Clostridia bacterium]
MGITITKAILALIAGIGVFLIAVRLLSRNIEAVSGHRLKTLFSKTSKSKFLGVGLGTVTAAVIQSSGAVTVMVIGFINAGLMTLAQGATIAFGANIGTTITGQIVALGMFGNNTISTTIIFMSFAGIGAFMLLFAKKDMLQKIGSIIAGFGLLFVGLDTMASAMRVFAEMEGLTNFISQITNPILLVLIGTALTALLQSSSVMSSILITMVFSGLITMDQGTYVLIGSNIGAGIVAILASIGSTQDAKRVALIHIVFNIFGAVVFLVIGAIMKAASGGDITFGYIMHLMFPTAPQTQLAMFHTIYNVIKVLIFLPLTGVTCKLFTKIIKDKKPTQDDDAPKLMYIEDHFLKTPPIAVGMVKKEVERMMAIAVLNFNISIDIVCTLDFSSQEEFKKNENTLNFLNRAITKYIVKFPRDQISDIDNVFLSTIYHVVSDLERIGDYAENIVEYATSLQSGSNTFSEDAIKEVRNLQDIINELQGKVTTIFSEQSTALLQDAYDIEDDVDNITQEMADNHIKRLDEGICSPEVGALYLELTSNVERIADHFINVAKSTRKYAKTPITAK